MTDNAEKSATPEQQMAEGNHIIGVFRDGKMIAADANVYKSPAEVEAEKLLECAEFVLRISGNALSKDAAKRVVDVFHDRNRLAAENAKLRAAVNNFAPFGNKLSQKCEDWERRARKEMTRAEKAEAALAAMRKAQEDAASSWEKELLAFEDFINQPPQYEDKFMVREYRHELYPKWRIVSKAAISMLAAKDAEIAALKVDCEYYKWRLKAIIPLFQEARDALPAISMVSAQLRGINLSLGDRMDAAGTATRSDFDAMGGCTEAARAEQVKPPSS